MNQQPLNNTGFSPPSEPETDAIDPQELLFAILRNWYWVLLCTAVGFLIARLYLRYTVPVYQASGQILIKDDKSGGSALSGNFLD